MTVEAIIRWAVRIHLQYAEQVAGLRLVRGLKILVDGDVLWLQSDLQDADLLRRIRSIPDAEWFEIGLGEELTRPGETVPCARLPDGAWSTLYRWVELQLPQAGFSASHSDCVMLKLARSSWPNSSVSTVVNVLQTTWKTWMEYAISAPQVRLNPLGFALSDRNTVLIRGTPLPPIPGRHFLESDGIIVPAGWRFEPDVSSLIARQVLKLDENELALFSEDGSFERLSQSVFVQATRSAVRASHE